MFHFFPTLKAGQDLEMLEIAILKLTLDFGIVHLKFTSDSLSSECSDEANSFHMLAKERVR